MKLDLNLTEQVYAAKENSFAADKLVKEYLPFIRSVAIKYSNHANHADRDDELSIAMFAFHEAVMSYSKAKGSFLGFAKVAIKNKLIDFHRKEQRHRGVVSLDISEDEDDDRTELDKLKSHDNEIENRSKLAMAKEEINEFSAVLSEYELTLSDIADNCPKQERTFESCYKVLEYTKQCPELLDKLTSSKKLPLKELSERTGIDRKVLERHRKYIIAIMLAYTNGFEIIRGHLSQVSPGKGVPVR